MFTSTRKLTVTNPNTLEASGEISLIEARDIERIAQAMLEGTRRLKAISSSTRSQWLTRIHDEILQQEQSLAELIASEGGKPLKDARVEVQRAALTFRLCAQEALVNEETPADLSSSPQARGKQVKALRFPIGPVLALSAFNHPLNLLAHQVGTALAAGNPVCFKPSPATPYCAQWLAHTLKRIGVDSSIALLVHADIPEINALVAHPVFQFVSFVGSAQVGWSIRKKLAPGTRLALEHGGVATAIVHEDADLEQAAQALCRGAFYHAGQVCISTQKIFVHQNVFAAFLEKFKSRAERLVVDDARLEHTDVGPLIRPETKIKITGWIEEAKQLGSQIALDQKDNRPQFMTPTILTHVPVAALLMREEAFAPVVCVNPYTEITDCLRAIEESPYHFAASLFTRDTDLIEQAEQEMACMNLMINDHTAWRVDAMAFGGHRQSGLGMGGVKWAVSEQTRLKQIIKNSID